MNKYITIDIGGTEIKYGIITENADLIFSESELNCGLGGTALVQQVKSLISRLIDGNMKSKGLAEMPGKISGICISTAGMVDVKNGTIFYAAPLIPNYIGTRWKKEIEETFKIPCEVENDVNCAGLAEAVSGAAANTHSSVCLTVGTGIGGCLIIENRVYHGFFGSAGEVGYMRINDSDFQTLASAKHLCETVKREKGGGIWDGMKIFEQARLGDGICQKAIEELCYILGKGIANICFVVNPQAVILGGGIMSQKDYVEPLIKRSMKEHMPPVFFEKTELRFAEYKNLAGMIGAFYHFKNLRKSRS